MTLAILFSPKVCVSEKSHQDDEMSSLTVQLSELQLSLDELSAAKETLETQKSELEAERDRVGGKLVEAEDAKMLISLRTGNFSDLFQQAADFD